MGGALCLQHYVMRYHTRNKTTHKLASPAADEAQQIDGKSAGCTLVASDGKNFILSEPITAAHSKVLGYVSTTAHAWLLLSIYKSSPIHKHASCSRCRWICNSTALAFMPPHRSIYCNSD